MKGAKQAKPSERPTPQAMITRLSDVEPQEVAWLWFPYIPLGKLTLLEGDPGLGKTFLALTLAAAITRGWPLLSQTGGPGEELEPADVLYMSAEDGLADTLRPRLDAADADVSRVHALTGWRLTDEHGKNVDGAVSLADVPILKQALTAVKPKLILIDPLQAYLGAGVDMHRANEVRPLLTALGNLAEEHGCAVVCIRHLSKSLGKALYAGLGSIDFAAAARSVLQVGEHNGERLLAHVKSSLAPQGKSIRYELADGAVNWLGVSDVTADDLRVPPPPPEPRGTLEEAESFLRAYLADGPVAAKQTEGAARTEGVSVATLRRAKKALDVISVRESAEGKQRGGGTWLWALPENQDDPPKEEREHLDNLEEKPVTDGAVQDAQGNSQESGEHLEDSREGRHNVRGVQDAQPEPLDGNLEAFVGTTGGEL